MPSHEEFAQRVADRFPEIELLSEFRGSKVKLTVRHTCGHEWSPYPYNLLRGSGCPKCDSAIGGRLTHSEYADRLRVAQPGTTLLSSYSKAEHKVRVKYECGHESEAWPLMLLRGHGCYKCAHQTRGITSRHDPKKYAKEFAQQLPDYELLSEYVTSKTPIRIRHVCGLEREVTPNHIRRGLGCPRCSKYKLYYVKLGRRTVSVRGYEPQAIRILKKSGVRASEIRVESEGVVPSFSYKLNGKNRTFKPDMIISNERIVEVKSLATAGLRSCFYSKTPTELFAELKAKARSVIRAGFRFQLIIPYQGAAVELPTNWLSMNHQQWCNYFEENGYI